MPTSTAQHAVSNDESSERPLPVGAELTPLDAAFRADPYPILDHLRSERPVHWDSGFNRWYVTGYEEVRTILRSKDMSSNPHLARPDSLSGKIVSNARQAGLDSVLISLLYLDDPQHRRIRALVNKPFSISAVEARRPQVREFAERLVDEIRDDPFDVMQSLAAPLPVIVIAEMLGVDPGYRDRFKQCSEAITASFFNPLRTPEQAEAGAAAGEALANYFLEAIEVRRHNPSHDLISDMLASREDAQPLTTEEILAQCLLLLVAGNVTTTDFIGNAVRALLSHPEQLSALRAEPELIGNAIEEVLRYDSPVMQATRIVPENMSFGGCPFQKGQTITASLSGANHDPRASREPQQFNIRRKDVKHQSFGGSKHLCLGAPLARMEAQEAVLALLRRFPRLELARSEFEFRAWPGFRGTRELWLKGRKSA